VCRKNPNSKVHWELVSTLASGGAAHMLTASKQHFSTPPALPYLHAPFHPQYITAPNSTLMAPYSRAPLLPSAPVVLSLPWTATPTGATHGGSSVGVSGAYALPSLDGRERGDVVTGTISVDSFDAYTLFDSGASFSFVSDAFVARACLFRQKISQPIVVNSAKGFIFSTLVCPGCSIFLADEIFVANLVMIPLESFDVILGMDWLSQYRAVISCFWKTVSLQAPSDREVIFVGITLKYSLALLYQLFPNHWVRKSRIIFAMMDNGEAPFLRVEDIRVVCHYPDVFPSELPGIPPTRGASFEIKLIPSTMPIHMSPYRMAPKDQLELKKQLDDLVAKGFIIPSKSP
jgi:hypothetical protein